MAQSATMVRSLSVGGRTLAKTNTNNGDGGIIVEPDGGIEAAKAGSMTTRTDNTVGVLTMAAGHGWANGNHVDVYWLSGGGGARYNVNVATVATNAITINGGTGDILPTTVGTAVTAMIPHVENMNMDGSSLIGIYAKSGARGKIRFINGSATEIYSPTFTTATGGDSVIWVEGETGANPVVGEVELETVSFSHDQTSAVNMLAAAIYD